MTQRQTGFLVKPGMTQRQTGFLIKPGMTQRHTGFLVGARNDTVSLQSRRLSEARVMIGLLAFDGKSATIREVGNVFNRDDSTIRFAVHRLRRRLKESEGLQNQLEDLERQYLLEVSNFQARPQICQPFRSFFAICRAWSRVSTM